MEDKHCQEALISAIDRLSDQMKNLQCIWNPIIQDPKYSETGEVLNKDLTEIQSTLDRLKRACRANGIKFTLFYFSYSNF